MWMKKAVIVLGKYNNNWAVLLPNGKKIQCHNHDTAKLYRDRFNKEFAHALEI